MWFRFWPLILHMLYSHNTAIQIYRCREIRNTDDSLLFRYEMFINFLTFSFLTQGERDIIFTMLPVPTSPTVNPPAGLTWPRVKSQLMSFLKSLKILAHRFQAWHHSHCNLSSYLGFLFWHLWLSYSLRASVNCTQCVCTCTRSWTVQSPTKPNDKI